MDSIGWTISQWKNHQKSNCDEALANLLHLIKNVIDNEDNAFISVASKKIIYQQWNLIKHVNIEDLPLYGVPFVVKDNIDVLNFPTTAACPEFSYNPERDATVVKLLKQAGAIVIGKTNLDQFATGLVGVRSPYGIVPSTFSKNHVCGGSSSGSAYCVSKGWVPFALGTDTAGSGRVPAHLNNIIGLKPTFGVVSTNGVVPACRSLDCVSIFSLTLCDAEIVYSIISKYDVNEFYSRAIPQDILFKFDDTVKISIPSNLKWYKDKYNQEIFKKCVDSLKKLNLEIIEEDFTLFYELAAFLYEGPWVAERYAAIKNFIDTKPKSMNETVYKIIMRAKNYDAADAFSYEYKRRYLIREIEKRFSKYDVLLVPTAPLNPTIEEVLKNPVEINNQQGTYTNFVNLADFSALSVPAGFRPDNLPFGVTFISKKFNDYALMNIASKFLAQNNRVLGATKNFSFENDQLTLNSRDENNFDLAVVGAHCSGMPLNYQLKNINAKFKYKTLTSPNYKLYCLKDTKPMKPGLQRQAFSKGKSIEVEVYSVPKINFGKFIEQVPPPLAIGSIQLFDETWVKGFVCEEVGYFQSEDISDYGSWANYIYKKNGHQIFRRILIANRGEIALRIIQTLKKLNIESVSIYSKADSSSPHVENANIAVLLKGSTISETYLNIDQIIQIAKETNAEAIIPGYGFLAENPEFVESCEKNKIIFIGPTSETIRLLGLKHAAKEVAKKANVSIVPSSNLLNSIEEAIERADEIGYPILLKNTAGGGGIGLQKCLNKNDLLNSFENVKRLGKNYFNDDRVFMEKFIEKARHLEVQIFGDGKGNVKALGVRDCSLQRRHQKIIEVTPPPNVSKEILINMEESSKNLCRILNYKGAGTVEYIYDTLEQKFYFMEVNARLQVEHAITEKVTKIDMVEWMILIAANKPLDFSEEINYSGVAFEGRIYAENPIKNFKPSAGQITEVIFPNNMRVDTWIKKGTNISTEYDPLLAKIIVHGENFETALTKFEKALKDTKIYGITTNIDYLKSILIHFKSKELTTVALDSFQYKPNALEILSPGVETTIQDYPGRIHLWHIGVPPSGAFDNYSFQIANKILKNKENDAGLEIVLNGPKILFYSNCMIVLTGGYAKSYIDDTLIDFYTPLQVKSGQILTIGKIENGSRAYLGIKGGIDVLTYLGSKSTFTMGKLGGQNGQALKFGDILYLNENHFSLGNSAENNYNLERSVPTFEFPKFWKLGVMLGPHGYPDIFTKESIINMLKTQWKVHYNANKFGIRLEGPKPTWSRKSGKFAGMHPSNIHDYVYGLGCINFTGDNPVIITCDGPSLGGFVCPFTVIEAEMWKLGQMRAGDKIEMVLVDYNEAIRLKYKQIEKIQNSVFQIIPINQKEEIDNPILLTYNLNNLRIVYRQVGDRYILIEYGDDDIDISLAYRIYSIIQLIENQKISGIIELSQGIRSFLIQYDGTVISQKDLLNQLVNLDKSLHYSDQWKVPSRIIKLPFVFDDSKIQSAIQRYKETIRSTAPYLPNNIDYLKKINKLENREEIAKIIYSAKYMVLGLGDVYLGAPCAFPLDPRHQLLGTKYNPSRSWTPRGAVGLGGQYLCIYGCESPGGYQLVGRTVPIWDKLILNLNRPWLFSIFDQIEFYPVTEELLDELTENFDHGLYKFEIEETIFDFQTYQNSLLENSKEIKNHNEKMLKILEELENNPEEELIIMGTNLKETNNLNFDENSTMIYSDFAGKLWKILVEEGDTVEKDQPIVIIEAMKTEIAISSTISGKVIKILTKLNDIIDSGDLIAVVK